MTTHIQAQNNAKAMAAFAKENPAFMQMALAACNAWGRGEGILQHCIAVQIKQAHEMGLEGETPVYHDPEAPKTLLRRSRPAPAPTTRIVRRTR